MLAFLFTGSFVKGSDVTVGSEKSSHFVVSDIKGQIFDENVVVNFSHLLLAFGVVLNSDELVFLVSVREGFGSLGWLLEAHETIATGLVIFIQGNFAGNNSAVFAEEFFKFLGCLILGDLSHECVVLLELGHIYAEEILVVG